MKSVLLKILSVIKELWFEVFLSSAILIIIYFAFEKGLLDPERGLIPPFIQVVLLKASLVSLALIHSTAARRIILDRLEWEEEDRKYKRILTVVLYASILYAYSQGG